MPPLQREYMRRRNSELHHRVFQTREDEEAHYEGPFPYYPYMPDHVTIEIGEAIAAGAASAGSCYKEICKDSSDFN